MAEAVLPYCVGYGAGAFVAAFVGAEETLGDGVAYEVELNEHRGHACGPQHEKSCLAHALVGATGGADEAFLYGRRQLNAVLHVFVLAELEDDIRFRRLRVEAVVGLREVGFELYHAVLAHGHREVGVALVQAEGVDRGAVHLFATARAGVDGVDVNRHEDVAGGIVGNGGTAVEGYEHVAVAREHHLHAVAELPGEETLHAAHHVERNVFLALRAAFAAMVLASVAGVEHHSEGPRGRHDISGRQPKPSAERHRYCEHSPPEPLTNHVAKLALFSKPRHFRRHKNAKTANFPSLSADKSSYLTATNPQHQADS